MIKVVSVVTVFVGDQDTALDFCVDKVGFEKRSDGPFRDGLRWVEVASPGGNVTLTLAKGYADAESPVGRFTGIVSEPGDIGATSRELSARGVRFTEPPRR